MPEENISKLTSLKNIIIWKLQNPNLSWETVYKRVHLKKSYTSNFSIHLFKIVKENETNPITYIPEDMTGRQLNNVFLNGIA